MADRTIQSLDDADALAGTELFVLQQNGAKKIEAQTFIDYLATALNGHGGINNISYTPPESAPPASPLLIGTLTVTTADGTEFDFDVTNGRGISGITWTTSGTAGDGMTHTGTIAYNDGTTSTVEFQDGVKGDRGFQTYVWIKWSQDYPTQDSDMQNSAAPYIGICATTASTAPTTYTSYTWYEYKGEKGDTGATIDSIELTSSVGLVDTYTITLTDGNTSTFTVTNAKSIVSVTQISGSHAAGTMDVYQILFNDGDTASFSVYNGANGLGSVSTVSGIQADGSGDVPQVISGNGAPTTATVGQTNQLYYDRTNSVLYYCAGESGGTYVWLGAGVTVDSALSGSSENPVQNKVITGRVGTGALPNSNTDLTSAINYVDGKIPTAASQTPLTDTSGGAVGTGTNFARNDHRHPLNVATSGVPADLGTAANGSSANYARQDHVHPMPTAANVGAVSTSDVQYKIYDSVEDVLGPNTSGSATLAGVQAAMTSPAIMIADAGDFASTEVPSTMGVVEIIKHSSVRTIYLFYGKTIGVGDYRKFANSDGGPTGTWVKVTDSNAFTLETVTVFSSAAIASGGYNSATVSITKSGYKPLAISGVNASGTGASSCLIASYYFTDSNTKAYARVRNVGTGAATITCTVDILYVKI